MTTIAVPRTLASHLAGLDWELFFETLGCRVVGSPASAEDIFQEGFRRARNDECAPIKMARGQVAAVSGSAEAVFVPQLVSLRRGTYCCPKVIGLPALARQCLDGTPLLTATLDASAPWKTAAELARLALGQCRDLRRVAASTQLILRQLARPTVRAYRPQVRPRQLTVGILGHRYTLHDPYLNRGILEKLRRLQVGWVGSDALAPAPGQRPFDLGCQHLHWEVGQDLVHAAEAFLRIPTFAGAILLTFFGCGIDAFAEEIIQRRFRGRKPLLVLSLDEHQGDAGLVTRLEAFLDLVRFQERQGAQA